MSARIIKKSAMVPIVAVNAATYSRIGIASVEFRNDGTVYATNSGALSFQYNWLTPGASAGNYSIRATYNPIEDGVSSGTIGSWESLGTTRIWTRDPPGAGFRQTNLLFEIARTVDTSTVLKSATVTIQGDSGV